MVHELMPKGIANNIVSMKGVAGVAKDMEEIVLSPASDEFFRAHMFANYGDVGEAVKRAVDDYKASRGIHENISSIADMARFMDKFPELKTKGANVSKHVALFSHIGSAVESRRACARRRAPRPLSLSPPPPSPLLRATAAPRAPAPAQA